MAGHRPPRSLRRFSREAEAPPASTRIEPPLPISFPSSFMITPAHRPTQREPWSTRHACARTQVDMRGLRSRRPVRPFPLRIGRIGTPAEPWKSDSAATRDAILNASTLSLCIHISRLNVSCPTLISIPCVPRYRAHPCTTPRGTPLLLTGRLPFPTLPKSPSLTPLHERTRWTSHARTSCYLSAPPIQISHPITHCICCLSSCSLTRTSFIVSFSFAFSSIP